MSDGDSKRSVTAADVPGSSTSGFDPASQTPRSSNRHAAKLTYDKLREEGHEAEAEELRDACLDGYKPCQTAIRMRKEVLGGWHPFHRPDQ